MAEEDLDSLTSDDPTEDDLIPIPDRIKAIITKVEEDYYWEDGGFIADWLRDDLYALLRAVTQKPNK